MSLRHSAFVVSVALAALAVGVTPAGATAGAVNSPGVVHQAKPTPADHERSSVGRIVWTQAPDNTFTVGHLVSALPNGHDLRVITPDTPGVNDIDASFSPAGRRILYERDTADGSVLRIVDADGRNDHVLNLRCTDPCAVDVSPTWLSNGRIAFTRVLAPFVGPNGSATSAVLFTARPDGSDVRRLSAAGIDGAYEDGYAHLSANGHYVVFARNRVADAAGALLRMNLDGTHVRQLTPFGTAFNPQIFDLSTAKSGPTKDLIVFDTHATGDDSLDLATVTATCRTLSACTSKIRFLTHNAGGTKRNGNPTWSPDGRSIAFTERASIDAEDANIWTMRYDVTHRHQLSTSPKFDYRPNWGTSSCH